MPEPTATAEPPAERHRPVLVREALDLLAPERGGVYVDCTVGLGGHAAALLERAPAARLVGLDRDPAALALAAERLRPWDERVRLVAARFSELAPRLAELGEGRVTGIFADLGVSSLQLDEGGRGFSFSHDGPLDMRMGTSGPTAAEVVNETPEEALTKILSEYGEERQARRVARAIVRRREERPLETTRELAEVVERAKGGAPRGRGTAKGGRGRGRGRERDKGRGGDRARRIHPATQTFQALRIEVNQELDELRRLLDGAIQMLDVDGRLVVISYHSLEDRLVKHTLRDLATGEIEPVTGRPRAETQLIEVLTRKPVRPSEAEVAANPRARSARLRAARRL